jgi:5-(hydroxymethyl)furfural/furfural oxidase
VVSRQGSERSLRRSRSFGALLREFLRLLGPSRRSLALALGTLTGERIDLPLLIKDRDALAAHLRENVAGVFHPVGTCRMGRTDDADAVCDPTGRVYGVEGLRVADASIMPNVMAGNTNLPVIMAAEKIADAIARQ